MSGREDPPAHSIADRRINEMNGMGIHSPPPPVPRPDGFPRGKRWGGGVYNPVASEYNHRNSQTNINQADELYEVNQKSKMQSEIDTLKRTLNELTLRSSLQ
jgi:hypothetical protein